MVLYVWVTVGPAIGRAFGPACVYSEKKARAGPGRARPGQLWTTSRAGPCGLAIGLAIGGDGMF